MADTLDILVALLNLEPLASGQFQGNSLDIGTGRVYGGQVLGQALTAAQLTVGEAKTIHSLHAYFLREGDFRIPIDYHVDITRDGKSFSTRSVTAIQRDKPIFTTTASFHIAEAGLEYQHGMPDVPDPDSLTDLRDYPASEPVHRLLQLSAPFDLKPVPGQDTVTDQTGKTARQCTWVKTTHPLSDSMDLHRAILAYISDYGLVTTALLPHRMRPVNPELQLASLDHGMWFHRPFRIDEWLLYACEPITTGGARGLARGSFYNRQGVLIATTIQEGLIRLINKPG